MEWTQTVLDRATFCGVAVLPGGEFGVYSNASGGPTLHVFDAEGVQLAEREVPKLEPRAHCASLAADPSGGWWLTATQSPADSPLSYTSLHRLPDRDASFASISMGREEGAVLWSVVATRQGALLGGSRPSTTDGAARAITATVDAHLVELTRWASDDLGGVWSLASLGDAAVGLAIEPTIDYGDAFLLRFDADGGTPIWSREVGTLGDPHEAIQSMATTPQAAFFFKTSREVVPGSPPPEPGNPSTFRPFHSRSVIEARGLDGDVLWEQDRTDPHVDFASIGADADFVVAWRGAGPSHPETEGLALSEFEVFGADGDCQCRVESPIRGRIVDVVALRGARSGSFLVASEVDQTLEVARVRVSPQAGAE